MFQIINRKMTSLYVSALLLEAHTKEKLRERDGQFAADHSVAIAITVGIAAVCLYAMRDALTSVVFPAVTSKIQEFLNFR